MRQPAKKHTAPIYVGVVGEPGPQVQVAITYPGPVGIDSQEGPRLILQGLLNLRMSKIRTELGSTYGTYARKTTRVGPGFYILGGGVDAPRAGESLAAMRKGIDALRKGENFERDFVIARRIIMKRLLGQSTESFAIAGRLAQIARYNLAPDYYEQLVKRVATVSVAEVKALVNSELHPNKEVIVLLGTRDQLANAFAGAGITTVKYVEPQ
jgi:zinc protease